MKYFQLKEEENELPSLKEFSPFKAVVVIEAEVSKEWQANVSKWLVNSGCFYMMAWGKDCSSWDCSVDLANIDLYEDEIPEDGFVITT